MLVLQSHMNRNDLQNTIIGILSKSSAFHANKKMVIVLISVKETLQTFFSFLAFENYPPPAAFSNSVLTLLFSVR